MHHPRYESVVDALEDAPFDRPFVTMWHDWDEVETLTFGQFRDRCRSQRAFLEAHGLTPGDTTVVVMPQGIDLMATFVGTMMAGAVPTILAYPNFKVDPAKYRAGLRGVAENLSARVIVVDAGFPPDVLSILQDATEAAVIRSGGVSVVEGPIAAPTAAASRLAFIQHSSGTTGLQKAVALTHEAVLRQLDLLASALRLREDDRIYSWLPLYHDMGLIACFMLPLVCHVPVVMQSPITWVMQPGAMLEVISQFRCTLTWVPNFAFKFLAKRVTPATKSALDLSGLRAVISCSEPVRAESLAAFGAAFSDAGLPEGALQSSYAMAENVFAVTQSDLDVPSGPRVIAVDAGILRKDRRAVELPPGTPHGVEFVSSGRCLPATEVAVRGPDDGDLPDGHIGQLVIRSATLFDGYYNRPDLTEKVMRDGWYHTGDLGFRLEDDVFVIGRRADMIIVGGENIYPEDVESIVSDHPLVRGGRVVALGVHNRELGTEEIVVVAETVPGPVDPEELARAERAIRADVVAQLGVALGTLLFKPPRWIVKSTAGKPARGETRRRLLLEHPEFAEPDTLRLEDDGGRRATGGSP